MSSPISPELQSKIANWRRRSLTGEITLDEMKEAVLLIRGQRSSAAAAAATASAGKRKKAPAKNVDDMLNELGSL